VALSTTGARAGRGLPWVPHAMPSTGSWSEVDERTVDVPSMVGGRTLAVRFEFDAVGDLVRASGQDRPRLVGTTAAPMPWGGEFGGDAQLGGLRLPTWVEVSWDLPEGPFVYSRGTVTATELLEAPFER
jgi:hypothetical protein